MFDVCQNELTISDTANSDLESSVVMRAWPRGRFPGHLYDVRDSDGDTIVAKPAEVFPGDDAGLVRTAFPRGTDPRYVARVLRKCAQMLEEEHGYGISHLGLGDNDLDAAQRLEDGSVELFGRRAKALRRLKREQASDDGAAAN